MEHSGNRSTSSHLAGLSAGCQRGAPQHQQGSRQHGLGFELLLQIHPLGQAREGTGTEGPPWADSLCCPLRQQKVSKFSPDLCDLRAGTRGIILVSVLLERRKDTPDQLQDCTAGTCSTQAAAWNIRTCDSTLPSGWFCTFISFLYSGFVCLLLSLELLQ